MNATGRGLKAKASARAGHVVDAEQEVALCDLFHSDHTGAAISLPGHCLALLQPDEVDDCQPCLDQRDLVLATIRDIAPRDAVVRMLAS